MRTRETRREKKEWYAAYYAANREKVLARVAEYRKKSKDKIDARRILTKEADKERLRLWRLANKEKIAARRKKYNSENKDKIRAYKVATRQRETEKERLRKLRNPLLRIKINMRSRIGMGIRGRNWKKTSDTQTILGCSFIELHRHLESKFTSGMSWENIGKWHVDHITPLASAATLEELYKLCHYTNLQPLWAADNLSKGAKLDYVTEPR